MTDDQKNVVEFYSGACISMFVIVCAWFFLYHSYTYIKKAIYGHTKTVGKASSIAFRHVGGIQAYIPIVNRKEFVTPLICVNAQQLPLHNLPVNRGSSEREVR